MFGKQAMQLTHERKFKMGSRKKLLVGELSNSKSKPLKVSASLSTHTVVAKQLFLDRLYVCVQRECQLMQQSTLSSSSLSPLSQLTALLTVKTLFCFYLSAASNRVQKPLSRWILIAVSSIIIRLHRVVFVCVWVWGTHREPYKIGWTDPESVWEADPCGPKPYARLECILAQPGEYDESICALAATRPAATCTVAICYQSSPEAAAVS